MNASILPKIDVSYISNQVLDSSGTLKVMPAEFYASIPNDHLRLFCHLQGVYALPTTELIAWLQTHVVPEKTIEIGAGIGVIGRTLGIPITDSCYMRTNKEVRLYYAALGQPTTNYPPDIIELGAVAAVDQYKPEVVIGCWITHLFDSKKPMLEGNMYGVDEGYVLSKIKKYIMVGNRSVHYLKPLLDKPHSEYHFDWLYSRSAYPENNMIFVWENL